MPACHADRRIMPTKRTRRRKQRRKQQYREFMRASVPKRKSIGGLGDGHRISASSAIRKPTGQAIGFRHYRVGKTLTIRINQSPKQVKMIGFSMRNGVVCTKGLPRNRMIARSLGEVRMPVSKNKQFDKNGRRIKPKMGHMFTDVSHQLDSKGKPRMTTPGQYDIDSLILKMFAGCEKSADAVNEWMAGMQHVKELRIINEYKSNPENWTHGKHGGKLR